MENWKTEEFLAKVKTLADLQFQPSEIAVMCNVESERVGLFEKFCKIETEPYTELFRAYQGGKLEQEVLLRKAIFQAAKQGSPPAQMAATKIILNNRLKDKGR